MLVTRPRLHLGAFPTPIHRISGLTGIESLWVKRDDQSAPGYGGNKVRKLEYILAAARAEGRERLITLGAAGSHHVLATAYFGKRAGFAVDAVLVPQIETPHVIENLRADLALGANIVPASTFPSAALHVLAEKRADAYYVHLGGSSDVGTHGYVDAAFELAKQIEWGECPMPDEIVVALGSGGTAAGLLVGIEKAKLNVRVRAVAISTPVPVLKKMMTRLVKAGARAHGVDPQRALARAVVDAEWVGEGYGSPTKEAQHAIAEAEGHLVLDGTYSAKAFAAALHHARNGTRTLFWHTLSSASLAPLLSQAPSEEEVRRTYKSLLL